MCFLQRQVEEGVFKVPEQDIPKGLTLVGQELIPQRQSSAIPGNPEQENSTDGHAIPEKSLFTPCPTHHLKIIKWGEKEIILLTNKVREIVKPVSLNFLPSWGLYVSKQ